MAGNPQKSSGTAQNRGRKRPKSFYIHAKEGKRIRKDTMLSVGMRGFLLTCNHGVKPCIKEAYNLLAEYADLLYGPETKQATGDEDQQLPGSGDEDDDMEASLKKEINDMKKQKKAKQQRFQAIDSGAKNVAFIKSKIEDPCHLVHHILTDIQTSKTSKSRHIMRMLPVTATFRSYLEDIEKNAGRVLKPHFDVSDGQELSFSIVFKVRNCGHLKRDDVITTLHRMVTEMGKHRVDLSNPDRVILVEGVRGVCCISVLTDFYKLRKYNLHTIMEANNDGEVERKWKRKNKESTGSAPDHSGDKIATTEEKCSEANTSQSEVKLGDVKAQETDKNTQQEIENSNEKEEDGKESVVTSITEDKIAQKSDTDCAASAKEGQKTENSNEGEKGGKDPVVINTGTVKEIQLPINKSEAGQKGGQKKMEEKVE